MKTEQLLISPEHLNRALEQHGYPVCENCLISQAVKDHFKYGRAVVSTQQSGQICIQRSGIQKEFWESGEDGKSLVEMFDNREFEDLRELLPIEIKIVNFLR